jgi:hypothetical protein
MGLLVDLSRAAERGLRNALYLGKGKYDLSSGFSLAIFFILQITI